MPTPIDGEVRNADVVQVYSLERDAWITLDGPTLARQAVRERGLCGLANLAAGTLCIQPMGHHLNTHEAA